MESVAQETLYVLKLLYTRMLPILFLMTLIQEKGWLNGLDHVAGRIIGRTGFSSITGHAFISNLGSVYAGSGLLVNMYKDGKISRIYLILSVIFAAFPAQIRVLSTSTAPLVFSLFSLPVALFYVGFTLMDALVKLIIVSLLSLLLLTKDNTPSPADAHPHGQKTFSAKSTTDALRAAAKRTFYYAWRITLFVSLVMLVVYLLEEIGFFQMIPFSVTLVGLPEELNTALYSYMANVYAGMGMIASLLMQDRVSTLEAMKLLIFCMMCSRPLVMIKESPSYYFGLYGPANGTLLILFHLGVFVPLCAVTLWFLGTW